MTTTTTTTNLDRIAEQVMTTATLSAIDYLKSEGFDRQWALDNLETLRAHLQTETKAAIAEGLADAKEAAGLGMHKVAAATFEASIRLAGFKAASKTIEELS